MSKVSGMIRILGCMCVIFAAKMLTAGINDTFELDAQYTWAEAIGIGAGAVVFYEFVILWAVRQRKKMKQEA
jgi:hypothetical protein